MNTQNTSGTGGTAGGGGGGGGNAGTPMVIDVSAFKVVVKNGFHFHHFYNDIHFLCLLGSLCFYPGNVSVLATRTPATWKSKNLCCIRISTGSWTVLSCQCSSYKRYHYFFFFLLNILPKSLTNHFAFCRSIIIIIIIDSATAGKWNRSRFCCCRSCWRRGHSGNQHNSRWWPL